MEGIGLAGLLIGLAILFVIIKIFSLPIKIFVKLLVNGIIGYVILLIVNYFGSNIGVVVPITWVTSIICGIFGIPGALVLVLYYKFLV